MPVKFDPNVATEVALVASMFGYSRRRVDQILAAAGVERVERGRVPLKPALQACLRSLQDELGRRRARSADGERLMAAKAQEIETRNARSESRVIATADHREICAGFLVEARKAFAGVPAKISKDPAMRRQLKAEFDRVFADAERRLDEATTEALPSAAGRH